MKPTQREMAPSFGRALSLVSAFISRDVLGDAQLVNIVWESCCTHIHLLHS